MIESYIRVLRLARRIKAVSTMATDSHPDEFDNQTHSELMLMLAENASEIEKIAEKEINKAGQKARM
ncbi:hypothetical protein [Vibrio parahaemolyticus]|uniref:hypothetical protein n=1 Tax=Vibrio parahaemolyticus TaxID=670 RepID=UPI00177D86D8|nr:hypothetical protein [Vibrio parahaemolyticus]MBD6945217.1 hypothetical protein [Vibrio parahaemolyticus]MBD6979589.1 hypothetical protein [Vibrio parahaemolyticus]MBD6992400.1 hypothetical protein [Vibrio parahaemolyticus]